MPHQSHTPAGLHLEMPARADSIGVARDAVRECSSVPSSVMKSSVLIVSELVTNAVRHAGLAADDIVTMAVTFSEDTMRVAITDQGTGFDRDALGGSRPPGEGGLGLQIVSKLSRGWGVVPAGGTVWAEIAL